MNANLQQQTSTRTGAAAAQQPGWLLWGLPAQLGVAAAEQGSVNPPNLKSSLRQGRPMESFGRTWRSLSWTTMSMPAWRVLKMQQPRGPDLSGYFLSMATTPTKQ